MTIEDLAPEDEALYFVCLEEYSDDMKDAGPHKENWYRKMKDMGLRVKVARDDNGVIGAMIHYVPIERSPAEGENLYFIHCIWVHGHSKGRGDYRRQGMGKMLLQAAEEDARALGAKGLVAWGLSIPVFMRASWFRKQGYRTVDRMGMMALLWKPFSTDAAPPHWVRQRKVPDTVPGKVTVTAFRNGWCPAQNIVFERAKRASAQLGDSVVFREYDTSVRETFLEWGISDAFYVDNRKYGMGPPLPYEKIRRIIEKRVRRLK